MRTKLFTLIVMLLVWLCLNNLNIELSRVLFLFSAVFTSYFFASWLDILPKNIKVNHNFIFYFFWLIKEIISSSLSVIKIIWSKNDVRPTFEWIDTKQQSDIGLVIYANSITLTPGTVTLDIKDNMLLVHALEQISIDHLKHGEMDQRVKRIVIG
jgi:multicomponent Na+:H+ antiporter subunit E